MVQRMVGAAALAMAASIPVAAQVSPAPPRGMPMNPSPIGDTSAIAKEAQSWLADLIKINTTNPPGNEQLAAMYIAAVLQKGGIKAEILALKPGRNSLGVGTVTIAMAG